MPNRLPEVEGMTARMEGDDVVTTAGACKAGNRRRVRTRVFGSRVGVGARIGITERDSTTGVEAVAPYPATPQLPSPCPIAPPSPSQFLYRFGCAPATDPAKARADADD